MKYYNLQVVLKRLPNLEKGTYCFYTCLDAFKMQKSKPKLKKKIKRIVISSPFYTFRTELGKKIILKIPNPNPCEIDYNFRKIMANAERI